MGNMSWSANGRFDRVLVDDNKLSTELANTIINQMKQEGVVMDDPALHVVDRQTWIMTPDSLNDLFGECDFNDMALMCRDHVAYWAATEYWYDPYKEYNERDFRSSSTQVFAQEIAMNLVADDGHDIDECHLIVVHADTSQMGGFIPLVRAIRAEQAKEGRQPVRVYVHNDTKASLRVFEEAPCTSTRQK